jgi:hypothetical protein
VTCAHHKPANDSRFQSEAIRIRQFTRKSSPSKAISRLSSRDSTSVGSRILCCVISSKPAINYAFTHAIKLCICCSRSRFDSRPPECERGWTRKRGLVRCLLNLSRSLDLLHRLRSLIKVMVQISSFYSDRRGGVLHLHFGGLCIWWNTQTACLFSMAT